MNEKTIGQCIVELLTAKRNANRRERYLKSLGYYLRQFARGREEKPLCQFETSDVENWLSKYQSAYGRQTWMTRLSTLFSFAVRRDIILRNPCDRIDRVIVDKVHPRILMPDEAQNLLVECPATMRPYLIFGMFAGIRPEEMLRLNWKDVNLETKTAFVDGKTRKRRYVPLEPRAVALLEAHPVKTGPVAPSWSTICRWKVKARALLGLKRYPLDLLRHTAASYLIGLLNDTGKVAKRLGNSEKTLCSHYYSPMTEKDCHAFWYPDSSKNVIEGAAVEKQLPPKMTTIVNELPAPLQYGVFQGANRAPKENVASQVVIGPQSSLFYQRLKALMEAGLLEGVGITSPKWIFVLSEMGRAEVQAIIEQVGVPRNVAELGIVLIREYQANPALDPVSTVLPWLN